MRNVSHAVVKVIVLCGFPTGQPPVEILKRKGHETVRVLRQHALELGGLFLGVSRFPRGKQRPSVEASVRRCQGFLDKRSTEHSPKGAYAVWLFMAMKVDWIFGL